MPIPRPLARYLPDIALLALLGAHLLLAGRWWLWNIASVVAPWMFLVPPIALLLWHLHRRDRYGLMLVPFVVLLCWPNLDMQWPGSGAVSTPGKAQITVFNWNTQYWVEPAQQSAFFAFLRRQDADVYHLQEYQPRQGTTDDAALARAFPGYTIIRKGEWRTLTRLPVLEFFEDAPGEFLRADLAVGGRRVIFYNVHVPVHILPSSPLTQLRRRFEWRVREFGLLDSELDSADAPLYMSGDFNTTIAMGSMRGLVPRLQDSYHAAPVMFPRTWLDTVRWWRIDWNLLSPDLRVLSHEDIDSEGFSDHWGQKVTFELGV